MARSPPSRVMVPSPFSGTPARAGAAASRIQAAVRRRIASSGGRGAGNIAAGARARGLDLDLDLLFAQAEALRSAGPEPSLESTRAALDEAAKKLDSADTIGASIARAAKDQD